MPGRKKTTKKLTRLQERKIREKSRRDERVRLLRKSALCVSVEFMDYAERRGWNDRMCDAAAWIMHRYFMGRCRRKLQDDWLPIPYQVFQTIFGDDYIPLRNKLEDDGFLEFDKEHGFKARSHCSRFRPCGKLRDTAISASYRIQSREIQETHIRFKKRFRLSKKRRKEMAGKTVKVAFTKVSDLTPAEKTWGNTNFIHSYHHLVQRGHLTETEFKTIRTLTENAFQLELQADEETIREIAAKQYERPTRKGKERKHDLAAFQQVWLDIAERTNLPHVKVKPDGRFYTPFTNLPRPLWNHFVHDGQPLASVDVKTSHPSTLLAFLKDAGKNYFGGEGTHDERLSRCCFERQISIIPALVLHLRRSTILR